MTTPIINISVFGSYGRKSADSDSDLDILVLCPDNGGTQSEDYVRRVVKEHFSRDPSISWYGEKKLRHFFESGDLFAWHLYYESRPISPYLHLKEIFGTPKPYQNGHEDISGLIDIMLEVPSQIERNPQNVVYELGLYYVCIRNIAMTASGMLCDIPIFGRYSPFYLPNIKFPLNKIEYNVLASCRHASTRGIDEPKLNIDVQAILEKSILWARSVERSIL